MSRRIQLHFARWLLPFATWWVGRQEHRILRDGHELTDEEKQWAREIGIDAIDKVRVLHVDTVPVPGTPVINFFANMIRYPVAPIGMAARYGIYLDNNSKHDPSLLVHELVHVAQYERLGGIRPFLERYFDECIRDGYWESAMEYEARCAAIPYNRPPDR